MIMNTNSFVDTYGATVTIPAGEAATYTGIKAEHLRAITQLLAGVDLAASQTQEFSVIANGLAHELEQLIPIVATDTQVQS
jgi:hypothetical protein